MPGMRRHDSPPVRRGFDLRDVKALDTDGVQGRFSGYLAVFNNTDLQGDSIQPGAFAKSLSDLKARQQQRAGTPGGRYLFPIYWNHNADHPCGGFLDAREDANGLYVVGELDLDTETGCKAYSAIAKGYVPAMSIGYFVVRYAYDRDGTRLLRELALFEGSLVANPANPEALIMEVKSASDDDKAAQVARSKKYGIGIKDDTNVTKPSKFADLPDSKWGDPVNYAYPMPDKEHADNAASRWGDADNRSGYSSKEQGIISKRIKDIQDSYGEDESGDSSKDDGKSMNLRGRGHGVKAMLDFSTAYAQVSEDDSLQDEWGDTMQALVNALYSIMCVGNMPGDSDAQDAADTVLKQFSAAMSDLVSRSLAAQFTPCLDDDGDTFLDPDAPEQYSDADDSGDTGYMSLSTTLAQVKSGRAISQANADAMSKALDMVSDGHKAAAKGVQMARAGHKALKALYMSMQPGASDDKKDDDTTDDGDGDEGKSLMAANGNGTSHAPGAPEGDTTQPRETAQPVTADEISQIIQRKMQAARMAAALGTQQSA